MISAHQQPQAAWKPSFNPWVVAVVVAVAAFMEVLDTSIANVALPHIAGSLGISQDQGTWVLTTYLVANAIVLPITGWISSPGPQALLHELHRAVHAAFFLCGVAPSFAVLLCARPSRARGAAACSPWRNPSWPTASRPGCAAPLSPSSA